MPHGITQCYLPPGRGDIPALTPAEAGTGMRRRVCVTVGCPSVRPSVSLSHQSTAAAAACGGFAAERRAGKTRQSTAAVFEQL